MPVFIVPLLLATLISTAPLKDGSDAQSLKPFGAVALQGMQAAPFACPWKRDRTVPPRLLVPAKKPEPKRRSGWKRWGIPCAITIGAGLTVYLIYSSRGR